MTNALAIYRKKVNAVKFKVKFLMDLQIYK